MGGFSAAIRQVTPEELDRVRRAKRRGFYIAQVQDRPAKEWLAVHIGTKIYRYRGSFADALDWLFMRLGIKNGPARVIDHGEGGAFTGLRVSRDGVERIPPERMKRAARYSGFFMRKQPSVRHAEPMDRFAEKKRRGTEEDDA
ncbi:MAG: hypothetical protein IKQ87_00955 [Clostridia bacterium]|nr:hypothetical protein [Clostridia bacterium]